MNEAADYLTERIKTLEAHRRELMEMLRKASFGVYTPLISETEAESIYLIHECPKCGLKTVQHTPRANP